MLSELKFTLIADGSSDKTLISIIKWLLDDLYPEMPSNGSFADFRHLTKPPKKSEVAAQIKLASQFYPYDILFTTEMLNQRKVIFTKRERVKFLTR